MKFPSWIKNPRTIFILFWLLSASIACYVRLYPLWGHLWTNSNEQATMLVVFNLKQNLLNQVLTQYPQMPQAQAQRLATDKLNEILRTNKDQVRTAIEKANGLIFKHSDQENSIYLLESDPFYFYNLTENILKNGRMADVIKGNKYFNPLMGAPFGYWQPLSIHPYFGFLLYKAVSIFNPDANLMAVVSFIPLILTCFGILAFMLAARCLGLSQSAIFIGSLYYALAPVFIKRSSLGWYDTDPYNLLFPFLILILIHHTIQSTKKITPFINGTLIALLLILYSLIWQGWVFTFFLTLIFCIAAVIFSFFIQKNNVHAKLSGLTASITLILTALIGSIIYGAGDFISFFGEGAGELSKFTIKGLNLWPNLYMEVGELKHSSFADILDDTGGWFVISLSALGLAVGLWRAFKQRQSAFALLVVNLTLFLGISLLMTFKAERFIIFVLIPLTLFFALAFDQLLDLVKKIPWGKWWALGANLLLGGWLLFFGLDHVRTVLTPIYNNTWKEALEAINELTPPEAIINTWWPPGHFIKAIAHRQVPFDGASLAESEIGYWMANIFLSTNEKHARGLIDMINSSRNQATDFLISKGYKTSKTVSLLHMIAPLNNTQARLVLKPFLSEEDIETLILLTRGGKNKSYLLIYNEMVDQNEGMVLIGRRDMQKLETINENPSLRAQIPPLGSSDFIDFCWKLSGGPAKHSPALSMIQEDSLKWQFRENLVISKTFDSVRIASAQYGQGIPQAIIYIDDNNNYVEKKLPGANLNYVVIFIRQDNQPAAYLMDKELANSMLMRLFYFDGIGLKNFRLIKSTSNLSSRTQIKVFEVNR